MWEEFRTFVPASENKMEEQKKQKAGRALAIVVAAAAVIALVAVIARRSGPADGLAYEKEPQVIEDTVCGFTFTIPAGFTRRVLRESDSTGISSGLVNYYALGRDEDISIQCYPTFFTDSTRLSDSDAALLSFLDKVYLSKGVWSKPEYIDLDGTRALRSIGPHPTLDNAVSICYDFHNRNALITLSVIYYTDEPARRPDWDRVRAANELAGTMRLH